jgi:hypothetical protein
LRCDSDSDTNRLSYEGAGNDLTEVELKDAHGYYIEVLLMLVHGNRTRLNQALLKLGFACLTVLDMGRSHAWRGGFAYPRL